MYDLFNRFCQYLWLEPDDKGYWQKKLRPHPDPTLKRGWLWYKNHHPEFAELYQQTQPERALVNFWLKIALDNSPSPLPGEPSDRQQLAGKYLSAFLQNTCYQVSCRIYKKFKNYLTADVELSDCFYIAIETTDYARPEFLNFLTKYESERGSLEQYFYGVLDKVLCSKLKIVRISDERLLCKASHKDLRKALEGFSETEPKISCILFARQFIKKIYDYNTQNPIRQKGERYPTLNQKYYLEVAEVYNYERKLESAPSNVFHDLTPVDESTIQEWFELAIAALKQFTASNQPTVEYQDSVNRYNKSSSFRQNQLDDDQNENLENSSIRSLFLQHIEEAEAKVEEFIASGNNGKQIYKSIPFLAYGLQLPQKRIAYCLGIDQTTISRHLQKYYTRPLHQKLEQQRQSIDIPQCVSDWLLKGATMANPVASIAHKTLEKAWKALPLDDRKVLRLYDLSCCSIEQVAQELSWSQAEVRQKFEKLKADLESETSEILKVTFKKDINNYLVKACQYRFSPILKAILPRLCSEDRRYLMARSFIENQQFLSSYSLRVEQFQEKLSEAQEKLRNEALEWIKKNLYVTLVQNTELNKLDQWIESWLDRVGQ